MRGLGDGAGFAGNGSSSSESSASVIEGLAVVVTLAGVCRPLTPGDGLAGVLVPIEGCGLAGVLVSVGLAGVLVPLGNG